MLQRLGRTGRRSAEQRNTPFLAVTCEELLRAAALLRLHSAGIVEPVAPPPRPLHIATQQLLGLALQKGHIALGEESRSLSALGLADDNELGEISTWLLESGHLDQDGG